MGLGEVFLYGKGTTHVTFSEFINKELVQFSNSDNERSLPSAIDGFKPGQRKVLFTCIKRNITKELKVAQLAGIHSSIYLSVYLFFCFTRFPNSVFFLPLSFCLSFFLYLSTSVFLCFCLSYLFAFVIFSLSLIQRICFSI